MRRTQATFKLAIKFQDGREKGESYWHPFGNLGPDLEGSRLYQHWIRNRNRGARALRHDPIVNYVSAAAASDVLGGVARAIMDSARSARSHDDMLASIGISAVQP